MGYTGAGKSFVAKKIAEATGADIYHSAIVRKELGYVFSKDEAKDDFFLMTSKKREPMDKEVYGEIVKRARESLEKGKSVVLDAAHYFKWQRKNVYDMIKELNGIPDVFIVRVECPEEEIIRRLKEREEKFSESELNETPSLAAYYSSKEALEEPDNEEALAGSKPIIIEYNTHTKSINISKEIENDNLKGIIRALK